MKNVMKFLLVCTSLVSTSVFAATINGSFGFQGGYDAAGATDLSGVTTIDLTSLSANNFGTGDIIGTINIGNRVGTTGGSFSLDSFVAVTNLFTVAGWQFDLTSIAIVDQSNTKLTLLGEGVLSGHGFDPTNAEFSFSASSINSYSGTVTTVVPVPAAVWLFGSGLIGLVGIARRKA